MTRILFFILFFSLVHIIPALSQINISYMPEVYSRTVDGLGVFQVHNMFNHSIRGRIVISAKENTNRKQVVTITTSELIYKPGMTSFPRNAFNNSQFTFPNNQWASIASQTRNFLPGEYTFCFRFIPSDKQSDDYENCFDATVAPFIPISLISPGNEDTICARRPVLIWQPPIPFQSSTRFRLILTEKTQKTATESILRNTPLLLLDNITTTSINYPGGTAELKEGKTYCWQVASHQMGILTSKSEIWEFTVQCKETPKPIPQDSYREIKLLANGNYYIARDYLKFSFENNYNLTKLSYSILDMENGNVPVKDLPQIEIKRGLNNIDIDLSDLNLQHGKNYMLKVNPFNELPVQMRFVYMDH